MFYQPARVSADPRVGNLQISLIEQSETIMKNGRSKPELEAIDGKNTDDQFKLEIN